MSDKLNELLREINQEINLVDNTFHKGSTELLCKIYTFLTSLPNEDKS